MATINVVWPEARLVVVCIPKVANSAIKAALLASRGIDLDQVTLGQQLRWTPAAAPRLLRSAVRGQLGLQPGRRAAWQSVHTTPLLQHIPLPRLAERSGDYLKVGFVRHPLDRLVSCYRSKIAYNRHRPFQAKGSGTVASFADFCELVAATPDRRANRHFRSQHCFLYHADGSLAVDMLGSFENLEADWATVQDRLHRHSGYRLAPLTARNVTAAAGDDWRSYFDGPRLAQMAERYRTDLARFGYAADAGT